MAQTTAQKRSRRRLSLSVRLSLLVLFAALVPLAAVVGINDYLARGTLVNQAQQALMNDAGSKTAQIDLYLNERLADGNALSQLVTTPLYLACADAASAPPELAATLTALARCDDATFGAPFDASSNCRGLSVGVQRDPNYVSWALFDARGHALLAAVGGANPPNPANGCPTTGVASVPSADLAALATGSPRISNVYYDPTHNYAYVQVYSPVQTQALLQLVPPGTPKVSLPPGTPKVLGFMRATLKLNTIWNIVSSDQGANGAGSGAFVTDQYGVRIADTNSNDLFTTVQPLSAATQQLIRSQARYGQSSVPALVSLPSAKQFTYVALSMAASQYVHGTVPTDPSSLNPFLAQSGLQWHYYVLSPLATVTAVADTQIRTSLLSAAVIAVLAILIGLLVGRGTTGPVRNSVTELEDAAASLQALAARQEGSAGEQHWVVDACKTGLESVRYLSDAMNQAARRIIDASNWFSEYWDRLTEDQARRTVQHLLELAHYIDEAARRQQASSDRLDKAITVTMQVSDQLVAGATAATDSAEQLEQVVRDLQHVVGGRPRSAPPSINLDERVADGAPAMPELPPAVVPPQLAAPGVRSAASSRGLRGAQSGARQRQSGPSSSYGGEYPRAPRGPFVGSGNRDDGSGENGYADHNGNNGSMNYGDEYGAPGGWDGRMPPGPGQSRTGGW